MPMTEIRDSTKAALLEKVRKLDYGKYLLRANIIKIRGFSGEDISFDFPVTALIGPNGSGKSAVLGSAACAYKAIRPGTFFPKSAVGDESMSGWRVDYDLIDRTVNQRQLVKRSANFRQAKWVRGDLTDREVLFFGIERTVPAGEKTIYRPITRSTYAHPQPLTTIDPAIAKQVEHILGKKVSDYQSTPYGGHEGTFLVGKSGNSTYSEFHFGAGESSVIRMVSKIENAPINSLILIEEIENGLHPIATQRMVEYLIDVAHRKSIQSIFTTHSDYAIGPLPNEAIWASIGGKLRQGRLSIEALRAVSGRVDKKVAIFVEDDFAKSWTDAILREKLGASFDQVEIHAVHGDGNAVKTHKSHQNNPSIKTKSICIIDGDSSQIENENAGIIRLPGKIPELCVFDGVRSKIDDNIAILTVSCQRAPENQGIVQKAIEEIALTNRDTHLIFNQVGMKIGFVPELIVRGAFLSIWIRSNDEFCAKLAGLVEKMLAEYDHGIHAATVPQARP